MFYQTARHCLTSIAVFVAVAATFGQTLSLPSDASLSRAYAETTYSRIDIADGVSIDDFAPGEIPLVTNREMEQYEVLEYFDVSGKYNVQTKCLTPEANRPGSLRAYALSIEDGEKTDFYDANGNVVHTSPHPPYLKESITLLEDIFKNENQFPSISLELNIEQLQQVKEFGFEVLRENDLIEIKGNDQRILIEPALFRSTHEGFDEASGNYTKTTTQYERDNSGAGDLRLVFNSTSIQKTTKSGICYTEEEVIHRNYFPSSEEKQRHDSKTLSLTWQKDRQEISPTILRLRNADASSFDDESFQVSVLDINGRPVLTYESVQDGQIIDVSSLSHGIYILTTQRGNSFHSQLFTK